MKSTKTEATPLMDDFCKQVDKAYSMKKSHAEFVDSMYKNSNGISAVVKDYEPLKFSSFRVFFAVKGTVLQDYTLLIEQVLIVTVFLCSCIPVYIYFNQDHSGDMNTRQFIKTQEGRMRQFAAIMMFLSALLLTFYTSMAVGRWWTIRAAGIGGIKAAEMELTMLISQMVTSEQQILDAIRRYARASLVLVFLWRRKGMNKMKEELTNRCELTDNEVNQLVKFGFNPQGQPLGNLHETIWAWQTAIVCTLYQEKKIRSEQLLRKLLEKCSDGRMAVQVIHTHIAVRIPMQYVHLLGLLVKAHNFVLALIMGGLFGAAIRNGDYIICAQLFARIFILPMLFNAILLINAELSDPFGGTTTDFPGQQYQAALKADGEGIVKAIQNRPDWMAKRMALPPV